jgi:hypothetical protein
LEHGFRSVQAVRAFEFEGAEIEGGDRGLD